MEKRKVKSAYTRTRVKTGHKGELKTKAVQSEAKHSDINNIVSKAYKTGQLPVLMGRKHVEQLPDVESYQDAMNKVVFAQQQFERLPSSIRDQFENKPEKMLEAVAKSHKDPELKKSLQDLGLLEKPVPPVDPSLAEHSGAAASDGEAVAVEPTGGTVAEGATATE